MSSKPPTPLPQALLPSSSRERKIVCAQLRQGVAAGDAEKTAQFESIVDGLMPLPPSGSLEHFTNAITPPNNLEKLECLLSGGGKLEDWSRQLRPFNVSPVCGLVWSTSYIGYRCKTCSRNPNMSLCADCFRAGNHEGHDSNMFRSSSGGTCDCGNASVMSPSGFCTFHGRTSTAKPPPDLTATAHYIFVRSLWRLTVFFRHCFVAHHQQRMLSRSGRGMEADPPEELILPMNISFAESDMAKMIDWLESVANVGYATREELVSALLDEKAYAQVNNVGDDSPMTPCMSLWARAELIAALRRTIELFSPSLANEYYSNKGECKSIMDELFRWMLATRLPTKLLNFLLSLLPVRHYASEMTRQLASQYPVVAALLCFNLKVRSETDSDRESKRSLAQRFLHVTVQLYSNADLAHLAVFECSGLSSQLASLIALLRHCSVRRRNNSLIPVVDTENRVLGQAIAYWPLVSDLYNLIVHRPVATKLLTDYTLVKKWAETMSLCHGMNANQRYFRNHIEMESESSFSTAYSLELEACSAPLWLVAAQTEQAPWLQSERLEYAAQIVRCLLDELENHCLPDSEPSAVPCAFEFSFHLPLHRALSALLHAVHATYDSSVIVNLIRPGDEHLLVKLVRPLIQLQNLRSEVGCNIWLRNGMILRTKALAYAQTNFASSFIDLDLSLIQAALSAGLSANRLVSFILEQYHVLDSFSIFKVQQKVSEEPSAVTSAFFGEQRYNEMVLLESALLLIVQLARLHLLPSMNIVKPETRNFYRWQLRREIVSQLCLGDRTYSELVDSIPQRHIASVEMASQDNTGTTADDVDACIVDVADFHQPDLNSTIASGTYVLKDSVWLNGRDFDPTHVLLRAYTRKDMQNCLDRFVSVVARTSSVPSSTCAKQLWTPFCSVESEESNVGDLTADICANSRVIHAAIFSLLFRFLTELRAGSASVTLPDMTVALAVYLLELGVFSASKPEPQSEKSDTSAITVSDLNFQNEWYQSDNIFENLCQHIDYVKPPSAHFQQELRRRRLAELPTGVDDSHWPGGGLDRAALSLLFSLPAPWRTAESDDKTAVGHSILSLLVNIRNYFSQRQLPASCSSVGKRVFDATLCISSLLKKISSLNVSCQRNIEQIESALEATSKDSAGAESAVSGSGAADAKSTAAAAKRREKILALMQKQQKAFLEQMVVEGELDVGNVQVASSLPELSVSLEQPSLQSEMMAASSTLSPPIQRQTQTYDCCICNLSGPSTIERPFVIISMCQPSMILHHRYDKEGPFDLPPLASVAGTSSSERHLDSVPLPEHSAGHARHVVAAAFREYWRAIFQEGDVTHDAPLRRPSSPSAPTSLVASSAFWPIDVHVTLCGSGSTQHACHFDCHHNYLRVNRSGNDPLNNVLEQLFAMPGANFEDVDLGAVVAAENEPMDEAIGGPGNEVTLAARELGEYACPLCRQLANCAVPLIPTSLFNGENGRSSNVDMLPDPPAFDSAERLRQIAKYLNPHNTDTVLAQRRQFPSRTHLALALRQFQADLSLTVQQSPLTHDNAASALLRSSGVLGLTSLLISVCHANVEFCRMRPASAEQCCSCQALHPLVACVAACCYTTLTTDLRLLHNSIFVRLTGLAEIDWIPSPASASLPLLSYDPSTLLLLFVLSAFPFNSSSAYISAVVQALFNLKVVQSVIKVAKKLPPSERASWKNGKGAVSPIISQIISQAEQSKLFSSSDSSSPPLGISSTVWSPQALADAVRCSCLPFLELASCITCCLNQQQQHQQPCLFENLRKARGVAEQFLALITCLGLDAGIVSASSTAADEVDPWDYVWFAVEDETSMATTRPTNPSENDQSSSAISISTPAALKWWFGEIAVSPSRQRLLITVIEPMNQNWYHPRLLRMPNLFDQLFHSVRMYRCSQCKRVPTRAGLCLICGHIICFREVCCNRDGIFEAVWHSRKCGAGTCLFLVISSSCVVCIRGPRYSIWGSPYLDAHGEEDRDLKRGRPLRLSTDRMAILERQWLSHSFDRQLRQWQWHSNRL